MEELRFGPFTPIGLLLGGMAFAVGSGFVLGFGQDGGTPLWIGGGLCLAGVAVLGTWRTVAIDPVGRRVRTRRGWLFFSNVRDAGLGDFSAVAIARTPSSTPSFYVQLISDRPLSLPTQGRDGKAARARARRVAEVLGLPLEERPREVSSVPMV